MRITRNEIRTALLVLVTLGALVAVVILVSAPGVFRPTHTYHVFFDNAGGLRPGGHVLLAGRKIGSVVSLYSPVPPAQRPSSLPQAEVLVEIQADREARIYRQVRVVMAQPTLLGEMILDFTNGVASSGLAPDGSHFIGERAAGLSEAVPAVLEKIDPVFKKVNTTLEELETTAANLNRITAEHSDFNEVIGRFRQLGDNLVALSGPEGELKKTIAHFEEIAGPGSSLRRSLANVEAVTGDLAESGRIDATLAELQRAAANIQHTSMTLNSTVGRVGGKLDGTLQNTEQLTDTLKRQPWRLVWPATKKYPEEIPVRRAIPVN